MVEAANVLGGKKGAVGVFEQTGAKDIVAFANMLTRHLPLEISAELTNVGIYGDIIVNVIPTGHSKCPDDYFRPNFEAAKLWEQHKAKRPADLRPEPEIVELIKQAQKMSGPATLVRMSLSPLGQHL